MNYRPEIDGLRAVAVLAVILFHAKYAIFPGGYLGVDIFFVISGYLISTILLADLARGKFSLRSFYERRARRILPAFFVVIAVSMMAGWFLMTPETAKVFYRSVVAATLSVSNIQFVMETDYFNSSADLKPLLHTWSLGVEEQFYIFFPLILYVVWRYLRPWMGAILWAGFALSLLIAEFLLWKGYPTHNFFLLPSRGWELLAGGYLAWREMKSGPPVVQPRVAAAVSMFGALLVLVSLLFYSEKTPHPGIATVLPVLGTCLIIYFGRAQGWVNRVLSHKIPVTIGLMSYSLYLWHNPVFVFARFFSIDPLTPGAYAGLILVSMALAWMSYVYVETPFRDRRRVATKFIWVGSGAGILLIAGGAAVIYLNGAFPARFTGDYKPVLEAQVKRSEDRLLIDGRKCVDREPAETCVIGDAAVSPDWAIVGDSHAGTLGDSLNRAMKSRGISGYYFVRNGCAYLYGHQFDKGRRRKCSAHIDFLHDRLRQPDIRKVLIVNRYSLAYQDPERQAAYRRVVEDLLASGKQVYLFYPIPEQPWNVPNQMFKLLVRGKSPDLSSPYAAYQERTRPMVVTYDAIGDHPHLTRIHPDRVLCNTAVPHACATKIDGKILYFDDNHLTIDGADLVVNEIFRKR